MADTAEGEIGFIASILLAIVGIVIVRGTPTQHTYARTPPPRGRAPSSYLPPFPSSPPATVPPPMPPIVTTTDPNLAPWQPIVHRLIAAEFPRVNEAFAMKWAELESDGNACAVGDPASLGPDGNPTEIGLGQLYNPDDFAHFGISPAAFRAYAPSAAPLSAQYRAAKAAGDKAGAAAAARAMQTKTRQLTQAEQDDQVRWTLLAKINEGISIASNAVMTYKLPWSQLDVWKLVKAPHALPGIINQGLPAVVKKLGRAPSSWAEFRQALGMDIPNAEALAAQGDAKAKLHWTWMRALNACEACGNVTAPAVA
jgi:hypothetical protein